MTWWQRLFRHKQQEADLQKELQFHLDERMAALKESGLNETDAYRQVRQEFGGPEQIKEECRDARGTAWLESLTQDLRYAVRILRNSPAFTLAAICTLALCSGANTAIFQLLDAVRLRTLPVPAPEQLAKIQIHNGNGGWGITNNVYNLSYPLFEQVRGPSESFSGIFAWQMATERIGEGAASRPADVLQVSGGFFDALQVSPVAGRLLHDDDDVRGCATPSVVVSYSFWQHEFGDQLLSAGTKLFVSGHRLEVVGVTPLGFSGPEIGRKFDLALPLCSLAILHPGDESVQRRDLFWLNVMGRLKPGWTFKRASEYLQAISPTLMQATEPTGYSSSQLNRYLRFRLEATPGAKGVSHLREQYDRSLLLLLGITGLVLLLASANLANLMLARASTRGREFAVRMAVGASRVRLVRQSLCESLLLSSAGAVLGLLSAKVLSSTIVRFLNTESNSLYLDLRLDWRMISFTSFLATFICVLLGVLPAFRSARTQPSAAMKTAGRSLTIDAQQMRFQRLVIVLQVSISFVLLTGALLFIVSFRGLITMNPGFREQGILAASFDMSRIAKGPDEIRSYRKQLLELVRNTPQVEATGFTSTLLIGGGMWSLGIKTQGDPTSGSRFTWIGPGYLQTLETPLLAGRDFNEHDAAGSPNVAIVNQTFARQFFPNINPLGQTFRTVTEPNYPETEYQIVGLIKDTKYFDLREPAPPIAYAPSEQREQIEPYMNFYIRTAGSLGTVEMAIRRRVDAWHSNIPMDFHVFQRQIEDNFVRERMLAMLSGLFGVLAVLLATIGLYGVLAYNVARRRGEIGIRMALGATSSRIIRLVMGEAALLVALGLALGFCCALALTRAVASLVFNVSAHDPFLLTLAALVLVTTAGIGGFLPAQRAARLDPMVVLRDE